MARNIETLYLLRSECELQINKHLVQLILSDDPDMSADDLEDTINTWYDWETWSTEENSFPENDLSFSKEKSSEKRLRRYVRLRRVIMQGLKAEADDPYVYPHAKKAIKIARKFIVPKTSYQA